MQMFGSLGNLFLRLTTLMELLNVKIRNFPTVFAVVTMIHSMIEFCSDLRNDLESNLKTDMTQIETQF